MSSLEAKLTAQLDSIQRAKDKQLPQALATLRSVFQSVCDAAEKPVVGALGSADVVSYDLFLYCAEAAANLGEWTVVKQALVRLGALHPTSPALKCRYLFCQCMLAVREAQGEVGDALVDRVQTAIAKCLKAIDIALRDKARMGHLVVAGTEHYWNAVRVVYAQGSVGVLCPSLQKITAALEAVTHRDWAGRVEWLMRLAVAESATGKDPKPTVLAAVAICDKNQLDHLRSSLKRVQFALKMENPKGAAGGLAVKGLAACQAVYSNLTDPKDQAADLLAVYVELAACTLVGAATGKVGGGSAPPGDKKAAKDAKGGGASASDAEQREREEIFAEVGLLAAMQPLPPLHEDPFSDVVVERNPRRRLFDAFARAVKLNDSEGGAAVTKAHFDTTIDPSITAVAVDNILPAIAQDASQKALRAGSLKARVLAEYTTAVLGVQKAGGFELRKERYANRLTDAMRGEIVHGIKSLVKSLDSAMRTEDIHLTQLGCVLIWNIALPLLNPDTRHLIAKPLQSTLNALESVESNLHRLKVQLLCELATCDIADEYLAKANAKVSQALRKDYIVSAEEHETYGLERPLDRYLLPMKKRLDLKADIYYVPDRNAATNEVDRERITREEVVLLLDKAGETKQVGSLIHMLQQACDLMVESEPPLDWVAVETPAPTPADEKAGKGGKKDGRAKTPSVAEVPEVQGVGKEEETRRRDVLRARAELWSQIVQVAWKHPNPKLAPIVRNTIPRILARKWTRPVERPQRVDQIQACLTWASTYKVAIEAKGLALGQRAFLSPSGDPLEPSEENALRTEVLEAQDAINDCFLQALELAPASLKDEDHWIVANLGVTYLNWFLGSIQRNDYTQFYTVDYAVPKEPDGTLGVEAHPHLTIKSVIPDTQAAAVGLKADMRIIKLNGEDVRSTDEYDKALQEATKKVVPVTVLVPMKVDIRTTLEQLFKVMCLPEMGLVPQCSLYEAKLLALAARALVSALLQSYVQTKLPPTAPDTDIIATDITSFEHCEAGSAILKEAEETCDQVIQALPTPMDGALIFFLLGAIKRLQAATPQTPPVPLKPTYDAPQERVLATLIALKVGGGDKEKLLKEGLEALAKDPNVELAGRLADHALKDPAYPRYAVQVCQVAKELEAEEKLGVKSQTLTKFPPPEAPGVGGGDKGKKDKGADKKGGGNSSPVPPGDDIPPPPATETTYTWYSNVLQHSGRGLAGLIDPKTQEKSTQTELRRKALADFSHAAVCALRGRSEDRHKNVLQAAKLYHQTAQPFAAAVVTRAIMQKSLLQLINHGLKGLKFGEFDDGTITILLDLYLILIQTCRDRAEYTRGLAVMKQAFGLFPHAYHKPLWQADVQFRSKMGQSAVQIRDKLRGVKGYDGQTQARAWLMFSRCTEAQEDQVHALQQAVDALSDEPEAQAAALNALAIWMYTHNRPLNDCLQVLEYAVDMVADTIEVAQATMDEAQSTQSGTSPGLTRTGSFTSSAQAKTIGAASTVGPSTAGARTMTATQTASALTSDARCGPTVQQLLTLGCLYTTLAWLGGDKHKHYYMNIQLAVMHFTSTLTTTEKELERRSTLYRASKRASLQGLADAVPGFTTPEDLPGWLGWRVQDDVIEYLKTCKSDARLLCPGGVEDLDSVPASLGMLTAMLTRERMPLHLLAVLGVERVVLPLLASHQVALTHALSRNRAAEIRAYESLGVEAVAATLRQGDPALGQLAEGARRELIEDLREVLLNPPVDAAYDVTQGVEMVEAEGVGPVYKNWMAEAAELLLHGRFAQAKVLLEEALVHAEAWKNKQDIGVCEAYLAEVATAEGRAGYADALLKRAVDRTADAGVLPANALVSLLSLRVEHLLAANAASSEALLAVAASAEAVFSPTSGASALSLASQLDTSKGDFLTRFITQVLDHHERQVLPAPLPDTLSAFVGIALPRAKEYSNPRGPTAVALQLLMARVQDHALAEAPVNKDDRLALLQRKAILDDQHRTLLVAKDVAEAYAQQTSPYPAGVHDVKVILPVDELLAGVGWRLALCALKRSVVNALLVRHAVLYPSVDEGVLACGSPCRDETDYDSATRVHGFLKQDIGLRFMTMTKKQRRVRTRVVARGKLRAEKYAALEAAWTPPKAEEPEEGGEEAAAAPGKPGSRPNSPPLKGPAGPVKTGSAGTTRRQSAMSKGSQVDDAAAVPPPPPAPTDDDRAAWELEARAAYPSDDDSCTSSEESEAELDALRHAALDLPGTGKDHDVTATEAYELADAALAACMPGSRSYALASLAAGTCLRSVVEAARIGERQRMLARHGEEQKPTPSAIDDIWAKAEVVEPTAPPPEENAKGAKKPAAKPAKGKEEEAPREEIEADPACSDRVGFAKKLLFEALEYFTAVDEWAKAEEAAHELARICAVSNDIVNAAKFVSVAQSMAAAEAALRVYLSTAHPQNKDAVLFARLAALREQAPFAAATPAYHGLQQTAYASSQLYRSLRAWRRDPEKTPTLATVYNDVVEKLPAGQAVLVLHVGGRRQHVYGVLHRAGGKPPLLARAELDGELLESIDEQIAANEGERMSFLTGDVSGVGVKEALEEAHDIVIDRVNELLLPAVGKFEEALADGVEHVVVCASLCLLGLPLESLAVLAPCERITRDLSFYHYEARLEQAGDSKIQTAGLRYVADVYDETGGAMHEAVGVDGGAGGKPTRPGTWEGVSGGSGNRKPSPAEMQRVLSSAASLAVVHTPGRLCTTLQAVDLPGLALAKRTLILSDRALDATVQRRLTLQDSKKPEFLVALESPATVAMLLLSLGLSGLLANHSVVSIAHANAQLKAVLTSADKGTSLAAHAAASRKGTLTQAQPPPPRRPSASVKQDEAAAEDKLEGPPNWERSSLVAWGVL